eukprot:4676127-Prymnesium_polylepis.1
MRNSGDRCAQEGGAVPGDFVAAGQALRAAARVDHCVGEAVVLQASGGGASKEAGRAIGADEGGDAQAWRTEGDGVAAAATALPGRQLDRVGAHPGLERHRDSHG